MCWVLCLFLHLHFQRLRIPHSPEAASLDQTGAWLQRGADEQGGKMFSVQQ